MQTGHSVVREFFSLGDFLSFVIHFCFAEFPAEFVDDFGEIRPINCICGFQGLKRGLRAAFSVSAGQELQKQRILAQFCKLLSLNVLNCSAEHKNHFLLLLLSRIIKSISSWHNKLPVVVQLDTL